MEPSEFRSRSPRFRAQPPPPVRAFVSLASALIGVAALSGQTTGPELQVAEPAAKDVATELHAPATAATIPASLSVDTANREEVRVLYRAVYTASENVAMGWTGNYVGNDAAVSAGDTTAAFKEAVNLRVNFFRALAGVPAAITFDATFSAKAQKAALMMSANNQLSHQPPSSWRFYSADGFSAADNSNLALGSAGPDAINGYIADPGANNTAVGHRRWVFYPQTQIMGTGDVAGGDGYVPANALWVFDSHFGEPRPNVRESFVAWPAPGYVPYQLVYPRWSLSYPNANFTNATVTMSRGGAPVNVQLEPLSSGAGENSIVWVYDNQDTNSLDAHARPTADVTYDVSVNNVVINNQPQTFDYSVTVFDPDVPGPDADLVAITGPATGALNFANAYSVSGLYYATGFQWRPITASAYSAVEGAENGTAGLTVATTGSYSVTGTVRASGAAGFHLAHPTTDTQFVRLGPTFLGSANAQLAFQSRLGYATTTQIAHVQISLDEGATWVDVFTQEGADNAGEAGFTLRTVALASLDGRTFQVRFAYSHAGGFYYPGTATGIGWYFDDIALTGVSSVTAAAASATQSGNQFSFTPTTAGTFGLQARGIFYGQYPLDWGPSKTVTVSNSAAVPPVIATPPASRDVALGGNVTFTVVATGVPEPTYQWRQNDVPIPGATGGSHSLLNVQPENEADYSVVVTNSAGSVTSAPATLRVVQPLSIDVPPASQSVGAGAIVTLSVSASGSHLQYQWYRGASGDTSAPIGGANATSFTTSPVNISTSYWVRVSSPLQSADSAAAVLTVTSQARFFFGTFGSGSEGRFGLIVRPDNSAFFLASLTANARWIANACTVSASGSFSFDAGGALGVVSGQIQGGAVSGTVAGLSLAFSGTQDVIAGATLHLAGYYQGALVNSSDGAALVIAGSDGNAFVLVRERGAATGALGSFTAGGAINLTLPDGRTLALAIDGTASRVTGTLVVSGQSRTIAGARENVVLERRLLAISVRAQVGRGDSIMIAGVVVAGSGHRRVLVRGIGPGLGQGIANRLLDPVMDVLRYTGSSWLNEAQNDNWNSSADATAIDDAAARINLGRLTAGSADSAALLDLSSGAYTAQLHGVADTTGVALVELYDVDEAPWSTSAELAGISMRGLVGTGGDIMIPGFIITGDAPRQVLIRAIGPDLAVSGHLLDPTMRLLDGGTQIAFNDDWSTGGDHDAIVDATTRVGLGPLPEGSKSAVIAIWLAPGVYTAHVAGANNTTGVALVEMYRVP